MNMICTKTLLYHQGSVTALAVSQAGSSLELWTALRGFGLGNRIQARSWLLLGPPQAYPSQASHMGSFGVSACHWGQEGSALPTLHPMSFPLLGSVIIAAKTASSPSLHTPGIMLTWPHS